ncbi:hypothetical protein [Pseudomonas sp. Irchel 3E20]|uniref:hypothetical protein n=1 Tax=Pseudomonas sp. Irchel 3E20 TaxID=2008983 RepID=UPI000BA32DAA|nr:hypothetical protein [Pseudomonas sp. Irchel 3E20]
MICELCEGVSQGFVEGGRLVWLTQGIQLTQVADDATDEERRCYQLLLGSGLVWKVDHLDEYGQPWLALQWSAEHWETLRPAPGSFRWVDTGAAYPVLQLNAAAPAS